MAYRHVCVVRHISWCAAVLALLAVEHAQAQTTISVASSSDFYNAVQTIDNNPNTDYTLNLTGNITLSQQAQAISTSGNITVVGNGYSISGSNAYRPFFIESGNVTLQNLSINNAQAQGGAGGGGGLGAGAAVFVDSSGHLTLQNVHFNNNAAIGGAGGSGYSSGGGGLGGNGGAGVTDYSGGGGGGLYGHGGSVTVGGDSGSGGGGGELGNGGAGAQASNSMGGGGGGGTTANGADGGSSTGGAGGGAQGGAGGSSSFIFGTPGSSGAAGGGGGGSGFNSSGGSGGLFGGGGGGNVGADGGRFGGGGGGGSYAGNGIGGNGGFGGGGGNTNGSNPVTGGTGGNGGFGGGGGSGVNPGTGGFGGGSGSASGGGGGAAFGGAVFVANGATITFVDAAGFSGNTVTAGTGASGAGNGSADGSDLFIMRGTTTTFNINSGQSFTFAPAVGNEDGMSSTLSGTELDKTGAGTLTLTGDNQYVGSTNVQAGTLAVNGMLGGNATVYSLATLTGDGTIAGSLNNGGTVAPGGSIGTLHVQGNYTQDSPGGSPAATLQVGVNGSGASDKLDITGTATIGSNSKVQVEVAPGSYTVGTHYAILTATGGVSGTFSSITASLSNYSFLLSYDADDVYLTLSAYRPAGSNFVAVAQTFNQYQVAAALDAISPAATGALAANIAQLEGLSPGDQRAAFNQLSGEIHAAISSIEVQTTSTWVQLLANRIANQFQLAMLEEQSDRQGFTVDAPDSADDDRKIYTVAYQQPVEPSGAGQFQLRQVESPRWTGWMQGYGLGGSVGGNGNVAALGYGLGGTAFGIDRWLGRNTIIGLTGGYAASHVGDASVSSSASINGYQAGVYGLHRFERCYLLGVSAYSGDNYTTSRSIAALAPAVMANSTSNGNQFVIYNEIGTVYRNGRTRFQPLAAVQSIFLNQQGFSESGAGALDLSVAHQTTNSIRPMLGARVFHECQWGGVRWVPMAQARWQHECGAGTHLITSSFAGAPTVAFNTAGPTLGRDFGTFTLGTSVIFNPRTSFYGAYDLQTAQRYTANMGSAGLQFRW